MRGIPPQLPALPVQEAVPKQGGHSSEKFEQRAKHALTSFKESVDFRFSAGGSRERSALPLISARGWQTEGGLLSPVQVVEGPQPLRVTRTNQFTTHGHAPTGP